MKKRILPYIIVLILISIFWPHTAPPKNSTIDPIIENRIDAKAPSIVLIGNSMLGEGINEKLFSKLVGMRTLKVYAGGSASAWWYLIFKNAVSKARKKPECVFFFFRDTFLTWSDFRVACFKNNIVRFSGPHEYLLERLTSIPQKYSLNSRIYRIVSLPYQTSADVKFIFNRSIKDLAGKLFSRDAKFVTASMERVFHEERLNKRLWTQKQLQAEKDIRANAFHFDRQINVSFLPDIIKIAKEQKIALVFVRIKRRRDLKPDQESKELKQYIRDLKRYLSAHGCLLLDFTHDNRIEKKYFGAGDHLSVPKGQRLFTRILVEKFNSSR